MMSQVIEEKSSYRAAFRELSERPGGSLPSWVGSLRERSMELFETKGFPTTDEEDWKYTNVAPIARGDFRPSTLQTLAVHDAATVEPFVYEEARRSVLVFLNGSFSRELSSLESLPQAVTAISLSDALAGAHDAFLRERLERSLTLESDSFVALNTAFLDKGLLLHVPKGVAIEAPIQILYLSTDEAAQTAMFPRVVVMVEREASATIIETHETLDGGDYFVNSVVDVSVGESARLVHYKVQQEGERAFHVAATRAALGQSASYDLTTITLGARLSRHNIDVQLEHEGAECWVDGLYLLGTGQHADTHSLIDHRVPRCTSHQNYKGILDGKSRAVFNGRIYVHPDAQQTDAFQSNKNLLLSSDARVDTKPQLEIYADDVKCAHGATVGQLEEEELFYLISRGLRPQLARNLLTYGFAEEIVEKIKIDSIKRRLDEAILNRLHVELEA